MASATTQAALITALKGQTLHIPSLAALFTHWPTPATNALYPSLVPLVNDTILGIAAAQPSVQRRLKDDIALLAAFWYPKAGETEMEALALFAAWLVCWDDEVDANEGDLAADLIRADEWRATTLDVIRKALNLPNAVMTNDADVLNGTIMAFGEYMVHTSLCQRQRFFDEVTFFIRSCAVEQRLRLDGSVPGYSSYMAFRLGTVGGSMLCTLVEFASGEELPDSIAQSEQVAVLRTQVGVLLSLLNDLLSLKKELGTGCVLNAVATLFTPGKSLDEVVEELLGKLHDAVVEFDTAAAALTEAAGDHKRLAQDHIDAYRAIVTGTLEFTWVSHHCSSCCTRLNRLIQASLRSPRYNIAKLLREDGSLQIAL